MKNDLCYIVGAGDFCRELMPTEDCFVIAADGGLLYLRECGREPDIVVGDFDSYGSIPDHGEVVRHPTVKDDTDMALAVNIGLERGYRKFLLNGSLGGKRLDHTIANMQLLAYIAEHGGEGTLIGDGTHIAAVKDGELRFSREAEGYMSVFCSGDKAVGVTLEGLKYTLSRAEMSCALPLGVSNEFTGRPSLVSVENGTLFVVWTGDPRVCERIENYMMGM